MEPFLCSMSIYRSLQQIELAVSARDNSIFFGYIRFYHAVDSVTVKHPALFPILDHIFERVSLSHDQKPKIIDPLTSGGYQFVLVLPLKFRHLSQGSFM